MVARADEQPRLDLLENSHRKIGRSGVVHGDGDHAAVSAGEKCGNPGGGIRSPENDAIAFANSAGGEFASQTERQGSHFGVSRAHKPVSDALGIGLLTPQALEIV